MDNNCPQNANAAAYCNQELAPAETAAFEAHLSECESCRLELKETLEIVELLRGAPQALVSQDLAPVIAGKLSEKQTSAWSRALAIAAAISLLVLSVKLVWQRSVSPEEASIARANQWFCDHQEADGSWDAAKWGGVSQFQVALSALPTLALLSNEPYEHAAEVARSAAWLQKQQNPQGAFGPRFQGAPYNQSVATLALLRAFQLQPQSVSKASLDAAIELILSRQTAEGGWGYLSSRTADLSITEWHLQALELASALGWKNVEPSLQRARAWLENRPAQNNPEPADSPSALFAQGGIRSLDFHRTYFQIQSLRAVRGNRSHEQLLKLHELLLGLQSNDGTEIGSWPANDRWGHAGGRLYSTALATLALARS